MFILNLSTLRSDRKLQVAIGGTAVFDTFTLRRLSTRDSFWYSSYYYISGLLPVNSADDVVYFKLFFAFI